MSLELIPVRAEFSSEGKGFDLKVDLATAGDGPGSFRMEGIEFEEGGLNLLHPLAWPYGEMEGILELGQATQTVEVQEMVCLRWTGDGKLEPHLEVTLRFRLKGEEREMDVSATFHYVIDLFHVSSFEGLVEAFNMGYCRHFGGNWNGDYNAFNDYLNWAPQPYRLTFRGWKSREFFDEQDQRVFQEIFADNKERAQVLLT